MKTPEEIKKWICAYIALEKAHEVRLTDRIVGDYGEDWMWLDDICRHALAYIQQIEEDKKRLQERICNQRMQLRVLHAMYEWALSVLQKAHMNDRAKLQAWLRKRGYELGTFELPESKYQQLERERDAAQNDLYLVGGEYGTFCDICKYKGDACDKQKATEMYCWEWRGAQEVELNEEKQTED